MAPSHGRLESWPLVSGSVWNEDGQQMEFMHDSGCKLIIGNRYEQIKVKETAVLFCSFLFLNSLNRNTCLISRHWPLTSGVIRGISHRKTCCWYFCWLKKSEPESFQPVIFCDGMKNILKQHLLLEEGQRDRSVAKQPLWLLFCYAGPLTRFSVKVASVWFDSSAKLKTCRNQRWERLLLMCLC